uniref:Uncharacterized protein n=1 Tax=Arundo donax TaxID=35708 RepID=A0A0A9CRV9_ARUDO
MEEIDPTRCTVDPYPWVGSPFSSPSSRFFFIQGQNTLGASTTHRVCLRFHGVPVAGGDRCGVRRELTVSSETFLSGSDPHAVREIAMAARPRTLDEILSDCHRGGSKHAQRWVGVFDRVAPFISVMGFHRPSQMAYGHHAFLGQS